jgi:hypothetical protein
MWLFTRYGFYGISVVAVSDKTCVRARLRKHLVALHKRFSGLQKFEIIHTSGYGYRYRTLVAAVNSFTRFRHRCVTTLPNMAFRLPSCFYYNKSSPLTILAVEKCHAAA